MKLKAFSLFTGIFVILTLSFAAFGQSTTKTIVLVRHAEKAAAPPTEPDPSLSTEGQERAQKLMKAVARKYKPHEIFSTNYKRTRLTAEPTAKKRGKTIQTYDPSKHADLVAQIMASKTDHYMIVGHSNTIPVLANLLAKKELFRNLLEPEYGVYWVIRMKDGRFTKIEMFPY